MGNIIKLCPFCGKKAKIHKYLKGVMSYYYIECLNCYCSTGYEESENTALKVWNNRVNTSE